MRRLGLIVVGASLVLACSGTLPPSRAPTAGPATAIPVASPLASTVPATPRPTPTDVPVSGCPTMTPLPVLEFTLADPLCFASPDVAVRGWLGDPPPVGWEAPYIEPGWLIYPPEPRNSALWSGPPGGEAMCGADPECAWFFVHVAPTSAVSLGSTPRWVIVTGHLLDPAAETCHYVFDDAWPAAAPTPPDVQAREECRSQFVATAITDDPG